jgi:hypothetical protein
MAGIKWTKKEINLLLDKYEIFGKKQLKELFPNRSWDAIKLRANKEGLTFYNGTHPYVQANLSALLEDDPKAYYWMGFLAADGYFSKKRLCLCLSTKDKMHLIKFCQFISCPNHKSVKNGYDVKVQDQNIIPKIREKFDLKERKTYNPPDISWITGDLFLSFMIGFIDGDGCIGYQSGGRKDVQLRIKIHGSWKNTLQEMSNKIHESLEIEARPVRINNQGYALLTLARQSTLRHLKSKLTELELPALERKWDKIE